MATEKCTFGSRPPIDIHMLNNIIYREVKHFRNYKTYRPNFGSVPVTGKFYAYHDQLRTDSEEEQQKIDNYHANVSKTRALGPHSKYPAPVTENHVYGIGTELPKEFDTYNCRILFQLAWSGVDAPPVTRQLR